uniref:Uncharacterized protein n=1 Tax=Lotharella oceanica TaxID=641309 RepID=A0A7S2TS55_9EUKA
MHTMMTTATVTAVATGTATVIAVATGAGTGATAALKTAIKATGMETTVEGEDGEAALISRLETGTARDAMVTTSLEGRDVSNAVSPRIAAVVRIRVVDHEDAGVGEGIETLGEGDPVVIGAGVEIDVATGAEIAAEGEAIPAIAKMIANEATNQMTRGGKVTRMTRVIGMMQRIGMKKMPARKRNRRVMMPRKQRMMAKRARTKIEAVEEEEGETRPPTVLCIAKTAV